MVTLNSISRAVFLLHKKCVISYPTESVFGIGCDPDSKTAVLRLLMLKKRSIKKGLILIASHYDQLKPYIDDTMLNSIQRDKIFSLWPGPITFVFPALPTTPRWLTGNFNTIAVRLTNHPLLIKLCKSFNKPLVSSSANLSGLFPCRSIDEIYMQFGETLPIFVEETIGYQNPSEIRDVLTGKCFRQG